MQKKLLMLSNMHSVHRIVTRDNANAPTSLHNVSNGVSDPPTAPESSSTDVLVGYPVEIAIE